MFESERLYFRGINETDTDCLVAWRSNPEIIRYFRQPRPITKETHERWYKNVYSQSSDRFDFIITEKKTKKAIGTVGVSHIDHRHSSCEISYMIAERDYQRRGYAVEAITAIMQEMIAEHICCFFAEVHKENLASRRTIEKLKYTYYSEQQSFITYSRQEKMDVSDTR